MATRIIIDRKVKKGKEAEFARLVKQVRSKSIFSRGYISGEMLRDVSDHQHYIVISAWESVAQWQEYEELAETKKVHARIEKLMARPTKVKIYEHA
jgi:heme-degrading monooxygenase HmoA